MMNALDISATTDSLERSMRNFTLNNRNDDLRNGSDMGRMGGPSRSDDNIASSDNHIPISETALELNSHLSLPYHWEQCLDLKTGEIYYINRKNGMKMKENPRRVTSRECLQESCLYSEEDSSYDSEESWSETSTEKEEEEDVLVVAGCKTCFMYFMVPKFVEHCPKCSRYLILFDRSVHGSP